jgi:hypothetical protein
MIIVYLVDIENCCYRKLLVFCMSTGYHLQVLDITEDVIYPFPFLLAYADRGSSFSAGGENRAEE